MALISNNKLMSIMMLVAIILITFLVESYSSSVNAEMFETAESDATKKMATTKISTNLM